MPVLNNVGFVNITNANTQSSIFLGNTTASGWSVNQKKMPGIAVVDGNCNLLVGNSAIQLDNDGLDTPWNSPSNRQGVLLG